MVAKFLLFGFILTCVSNMAQGEPGVTATEVKIGSTGSFTGVIPDYGKSMAAGANAFYAKINKAGGVNGRKIKLVSLDDAADPKLAMENAVQLVEKEKVFAMVGGNGSAGMKVILPYLIKEKIPLLFPYTGAEFLRSPVIPQVFNVRASYGEEASELIKYLVGVKHLSDFGIFYQDDAFGVSGRDGVVKALEKHQLRLLRSSSGPRDETNFTKAVENLKAANAKVVFLSTTFPLAVGFIKESIAKDYKPIFVGPSSVGAVAVLNALGKGDYQFYASEVVPLPTDTSFAIVKEYQRDMTESGQVAKLASIGLEGYLGARVFVEGLKRAGPNVSRLALQNALETIKNFDFGGLSVSFSPSNHQGLDHNFMFLLTDGATQPVH